MWKRIRQCDGWEFHDSRAQGACPGGGSLNVRVVVGSKEIETPVRDISKRGIFLYTKEPPAVVGAPLTLKLAMTAGIKSLTIQAKVVRIVMEADSGLTATLGMALRFVDLDLAAEKLLMDLIDPAHVGQGHPDARVSPRVSPAGNRL